ncbi:hypothetical protein HYPDE_33903 [Hyphomicrobium denitrificans 1NES1]|uniref:Uncharacterized protein n=1 Tax=Hyphomicrobium denitrificans 1NES1 TaxID=670307 RepID=N0B616_9HYPH|nr:hypothetical protein HYPDE_33903 [Hyphomicrobium denitrificans 1NES1]
MCEASRGARVGQPDPLASRARCGQGDRPSPHGMRETVCGISRFLKWPDRNPVLGLSRSGPVPRPLIANTYAAEPVRFVLFSWRQRLRSAEPAVGACPVRLSFLHTATLLRGAGRRRVCVEENPPLDGEGRAEGEGWGEAACRVFFVWRNRLASGEPAGCAAEVAPTPTPPREGEGKCFLFARRHPRPSVAKPRRRPGIQRKARRRRKIEPSALLTLDPLISRAHGASRSASRPPCARLIRGRCFGFVLILASLVTDR